MKNLSDIFSVSVIFVWVCISIASSQIASIQINSINAQTNTGLTPVISPTPSQKTDPAEWICDERWQGSSYIFVGTVKEVKTAKNLAPEKRTELKKRLSQYGLKNLVSFQIEKTYKGGGKSAEIEILNLKTGEKPAINFKAGEKYLLYLEAETVNKTGILFYYARPESRTKIYAESAETIAFLEENFRRNLTQEFFGDFGKDVIPGGILGGRAVNLPKPKFPEDAKKDKWSGSVWVYVLVDETGQVIKAKAVCAKYESIAKATEAAALNSKYSPTLLSGKPVKVTGVLVYNFVP
jgi:hypothetical protein